MNERSIWSTYLYKTRIFNRYIPNHTFEHTHSIFECVIIVWIFKVLLDNLLRIYKQIPKNTEISNIRNRLGANNSLGKSYYSSHKSSVMKHFILAKNKWKWAKQTNLYCFLKYMPLNLYGGPMTWLELRRWCL